MNQEAEQVLTDVKRVKNVQDKHGKLTQKAKRYLTFQERETREEDLKNIRRQLGQPEWVNTGLSAEGRSSMVRSARSIETDLEENAPPKSLSGETKDRLAKRKQELANEIRVGMLTHEEMRRNPPGAVDHNRKWNKANQERILEFKNVCRALEPDSDSKDLASIEMLRPSKGATFMPDAQIPGHMAYGSVPEANWNQTFGPAKTVNPLRQAEIREKRQAAMAKAREARAAKRAAKSEPI